MTDSAKTTGVEQRKRRTRRALTKHARRLTIEHGLNGFTVEQVCELADVSRRTFFNYFASKEDAIVGAPNGPDETILEAFRLARPAGTIGLSPTLLDDLITLAVTAIGEFDDFDELDDPRKVIAREPQLLTAFIGAGETAERELATLIAEREHLAPADPTIALFVTLFTALVRTSADQFFRHDNTQPLATHLSAAVASARLLFHPRPEGSRS